MHVRKSFKGCMKNSMGFALKNMQVISEETDLNILSSNMKKNKPSEAYVIPVASSDDEVGVARKHSSTSPHTVQVGPARSSTELANSSPEVNSGIEVNCSLAVANSSSEDHSEQPSTKSSTPHSSRKKKKKGFCDYVELKIFRIEELLEPYFGGHLRFVFVRRLILSVVVFVPLWYAYKTLMPSVPQTMAIDRELVLSLRLATAYSIAMGTWCQYLLYTSIVRAACRVQAHRMVMAMTGEAPKDLSSFPEEIPSSSSGGGSAPLASSEALRTLRSMIASNALIPDAAACLTAFHWTWLYFICLFILCFFGSGDAGGARRVAFFFSTVIGMLCLLPRAAEGWLPGHGRQCSRLVLKMLLVGAPVAVLPALLIPLAAKANMSSDDMVLVYPAFLSVLEFFGTTRVFSDASCADHSDETLYMVGHAHIALHDASRVGMLVVVSNTSGSFQGVVGSTVLTILMEILSRNNLFTLTFRFIHRSFIQLTRPPSSNEPLPPLNPPLHRYKRVVLGCREDTEYQAIIALFLMKVTNYGMPPEFALDEVTSELSDELNCGWDVLAVIFLGKCVEDGLTELVKRFVCRYFKALSPDLPPQKPIRSAFLNLMMWIFIAGLYLSGIGYMGGLVDEFK